MQTKSRWLVIMFYTKVLPEECLLLIHGRSASWFNFIPKCCELLTRLPSQGEYCAKCKEPRVYMNPERIIVHTNIEFVDPAQYGRKLN